MKHIIAHLLGLDKQLIEERQRESQLECALLGQREQIKELKNKLQETKAHYREELRISDEKFATATEGDDALHQACIRLSQRNNTINQLRNVNKELRQRVEQLENTINQLKQQ